MATSQLDPAKTISQQLSISLDKVKATITLLDDGNTLAFIARYRKEKTGELDEEQIRLITENLNKFRKLEDRRTVVLKTVKEIGKLDGELEKQILLADNLTVLEDIYQPYKPKRNTKASLAREKGLQGLADLILEQPESNIKSNQYVAPFVGGKVETPNQAWEGARHIVAEMINDHAGVRQSLRLKAEILSILRSTKIKKATDEREVYSSYYDFQIKVKNIRPHQTLAINRGEKEKILRVKIEFNERDSLDSIRSHIKVNPLSPLSQHLEIAIEDSANRLLLPFIEREIRRSIRVKAENHAIDIFAKNLRGLLSQAPLSGHVILGLDPGYRTGCKIAVIDKTGQVLNTGTIYPHKPQTEISQSKNALSKLILDHNVSLICIGNGTASRESVELITELIKEKHKNLKYLVVSEAGASVYSASKIARKEFPDMDVSIRGAVSIARRVQDPLAELVKIDPKSIGVGLYQHDVDQKKLSESLTFVVESVVNQVGVDLSTASSALLSFVSGIGEKLAERIVDFRNKNGLFPDRNSLKNVPGLGEKAFEQCAGFIRINDGINPLDASAIHPESYQISEKIMKNAGTSIVSPFEKGKQAIEIYFQKQTSERLVSELGVAKSSLEDILEQLIRPGRDPRDEGTTPILKSELLSMEDLTSGLILNGTVRNVVDFGAFVDIGVKQDGLLHRSQIPQNTVLHLGQVLQLEVGQVDIDRGRISLHWVKS